MDLDAFPSDGKAIGTVKYWHEEEGWGAFTAEGLPGDVFAHFSMLNMPGYRTAAPGARVAFSYRTPGQDGCWATAVVVELLD